MSNVYEQFETDTSIEKKGIEIDYGSFSFQIARAGGSNQAYQKCLEKLTRPYRRAIETDNMNPDLAQKLLVEAFSRTVVVGWTNVQGRDGNDMEFTVNNCIALLTDLPELFADLQKQANNASLFKKDILDKDVGK